MFTQNTQKELTDVIITKQNVKRNKHKSFVYNVIYWNDKRFTYIFVHLYVYINKAGRSQKAYFIHYILMQEYNDVPWWLLKWSTGEQTVIPYNNTMQKSSPNSQVVTNDEAILNKDSDPRHKPLLDTSCSVEFHQFVFLKTISYEK